MTIPNIDKTSMLENIWVWASRIFAPLFVVIMFLSSFIMKDVLSSLSNIDERVVNLELRNAEVSGNRFTSGDWANHKALLDDRANALDRRVIRLEEAIPPIKDSLIRIENKLDKMNGVNRE